GGGKNFSINDLIGDIEYDVEENEIKFRVGTENEDFNKGNVVLALRNSSNQIVWSWHIWLTDKPRDLAFEQGVFMDRNLGALTSSASPDAYGFVYQWGRKDPFYGSDGSNTQEASTFQMANDNTIINTNLQWSVKIGQGIVDDALRNPMQFICDDRASLPIDQLPDWLTVSNNDLWDANGAKTDNDPCPYGYRVPSEENFAILHDAFDQNGSNYYFKRIENAYWEYKFSGPPSVANNWPAAGRRQGGSHASSEGVEGGGGQMRHSGTVSEQGLLYYWTRTPMNVGGVSFLGASHRLYSHYTNKLYRDNYEGRADAYSVRCVKE
ncbi:MAG: hypothetical protein LBN11_04880, partial [Tannerella sp.]|nr:hypothetical protein [Tannerella sp.]